MIWLTDGLFPVSLAGICTFLMYVGKKLDNETSSSKNNNYKCCNI